MMPAVKVRRGMSLALLSLLFGAAACANKDAVLGVVPPSSGPSVSLSRDIQPILTASCATAFCHGSPLGAPMSLLSSDTHASLVGIPSCEAPSLKRVEAGSSAASYLTVKLEGTQSTVLGAGGCGVCSFAGVSVGNCGARMPLSGPPYLSDAEVQRIGEWIDQGAADN